MTLQRQELELLLTGGIDEKSGPEVSEPTTLRAVTNLRWSALGQLAKRPTYASTAAVPTENGSFYANPYVEGLYKRGNEVFTLDNNWGVAKVDFNDPTRMDHACFLDPAGDNIAQYAPRSCKVYPRKVLERAQFDEAEAGIDQVVAANYLNHLVIAWTTFGSSGAYTLKYKVVDITTGQTIVPTRAQAITATPYMQACTYSATGLEGVLITWCDGAGVPISIKTILYSYANKSFAASSTLTTNARRLNHHLVSDGGLIYLTIIDNTANAVKVFHGTVATISGGTSTNHQATTTGTIGGCVVVGPVSDFILSHKTTEAYAEIFGAPANVQSIMTRVSPEVFCGITGSLESSSVDRIIVYIPCFSDEVIGGTTAYRTRVRTSEVSVSVTTPVINTTDQSAIPNAWVASQAFSANNRSYVANSFNVLPLDAQTVGSVVIQRYANSDSAAHVRHDPIARLLHDRYFSLDVGFASNFALPIEYNSSIHFVFTGDASADEVDFGGNEAPQTIYLSRLGFRSDIALPLPSVEVDNTTLIASGMLVEYDGDLCSEHTPIGKPICHIDSSAAGSTTFTQAAAVRAIWRWVDAQGRLHRSRPSLAVSTGTFNTQQLDIYVTKPPMAAYDGETVYQHISPELYITTQNGATYYLACNSSSEKLTYTTPAGMGHHWLFSNVLEGNAANPQLYTNGGELDSEPPPSFADITMVGDRLWAIEAEDPTRIWFTKPFSAGISVEWNATNVMVIPDSGVSVRDVNGVPTIFGARGIHQFYGEGPDANGAGQAYPPSRRLPHEISCIDPLCVVKIPQGVFFRSRRGFVILGNDLNLLPVGLPLEPSTRLGDQASAYRYTKAVYDELQNEIRIVDATDSAYYVFNLLEGKWARWRQDPLNQYAVDLTVADGRVWYLHYDASANTVRREKNVDESSHNSSAEGWSLQGQWIRLDGIAGFGRLWELVLILDEGTNKANVTSLVVTYEYKGSETVSGSEVFTFTGAELAAMTVNNLVIQPANDEVRSFRITVAETCAGATTGNTPIVARAVLGVDGKAFRLARGANPKGPA